MHHQRTVEAPVTFARDLGQVLECQVDTVTGSCSWTSLELLSPVLRSALLFEGSPGSSRKPSWTRCLQGSRPGCPGAWSSFSPAAVNEGHPPFSDTPNYPIVKTKVPWFSMFLETFWGSMPAGSRLKSWDRTWIPTAVHFRSFVLKAATSGPSTSQTVGLGFSSFLPDSTKRSPETNEIPRTAWGHQKNPNLIRFFLMFLMWMKKTNKAHIRSLWPLASYPGATCFPPHLKHLPK